MLQVRDGRSGVGDAHSRAGAGDAHSREGVTSCPRALAYFCLSLDSFLLRLPRDHHCPSISTSPGCFQPSSELFPGKAEGCQRAKRAVEAAWGAEGVQSLAGQSVGCSPASHPTGRGTGGQGFSAWSQTTLGHLGRVVHICNPISHLQGRGEAQVGALSVQWAWGCGKGRSWGASTVVPGKRRVIFAAGRGI